MDTIQSAEVTTSAPPETGLLGWLRALLLRLLGASDGAPAATRHASMVQSNDPAENVSQDADGAFVIAPGGYRIRVPDPSDVGHSVGEMLPSVREGLSLLPPLPTVVIELLREIQDAKSTAASVAEVASSDPSLAASLLRTANGAAMGLSRTITSVSEAVSYLGFGTVKAMVIRLRLDQVLLPKNDLAAQDAEDLWVHCLSVSYAAECLSQRVSGVDRGFVATLGLLHDVGKLAILAQLPDLAIKLRAEAGGDADGGRLAHEARILGLDHAGIGANLAAKWRLPADLVQAIRWHHRPANAFHPTDPPALRKALHLVQIANQLVKYCYPHSDVMEIDAVGDEAFELLSFEPSLAKLLDKPVRDAISKAMYFADGNSRRPGAARRFLRPICGIEAARIAGAPDGAEPRVGIDDAWVEQLFSDEATELCGESLRIPKVTGIPHARFTVPATAPGLQRCLTVAREHQDNLNIPLEIRSLSAFTLKSLLPNLLPLAKAGETIEVIQSMHNHQLTLAIRTPGLATARRLGVPATPLAARRLAEADFANLLNLAWFDKIVISSDGSSIILAGR